MLDNQLIALIKQIMDAALLAAGEPYSTIAVKQSYQPTNQGPNSGSTLYLNKVHDHRYGYPLRKSELKFPEQIMQKTQAQFIETIFQFQATSTQNPEDLAQLTASDIANRAAFIMASDETLATLAENQIGILRIGDIKNIPMVDDRDRYEYVPSFDFTIEHELVIISTDPVAEKIIVNIERV